MIKCEINNITLNFTTSPLVFSPSGVDQGTLAMLAQITFAPTDKVLDLGCGYGVVGILAAKTIGPDRVVLCDIAAEAVALAGQNAALNGCAELRIIQSDGLAQIADQDFTLILSNPPYHVDFAVPKRFIEDGYRHLAIGGRLLMVTKRKDWYKNKLIAVFGGVQIIEAEGYYVFCAQKRLAQPAKQIRPKTANLSKKLRRKQSKRDDQQT